MKYFFVLFFCIFSFHLKAQTPGYLGKRLIVEASLNTFVASKPTTAKLNTRILSPSINLSYKISTDYVLSKQNMIGLEYAFFQTVFLQRTASFGDGYYKLGFTKVSTRFTRFRSKRGGMAPLGKSWGVGLDLYSLNSAVEFAQADYTPIHNSVNNLIKTYYYPSFSIHWSNRRIFQDRWLIAYGAQIVLVTSAVNTNVGPDHINNQFIIQNRREIYTRLVNRELYNLQISIGYLIF